MKDRLRLRQKQKEHGEKERTLRISEGASDILTQQRTHHQTLNDKDDGQARSEYIRG